MLFKIDLSDFSDELLDVLEGDLIGFHDELENLDPVVGLFFDGIRKSISDELDARTNGESKPGEKEYRLPDKSEFTGQALMNCTGFPVILANHGSPEARAFAWRMLAALIFDDSHWY